MNSKMSNLNEKQDEFLDLLKRTYEKGMNEKEMTVEQLLEDIKIDIQKVLTR